VIGQRKPRYENEKLRKLPRTSPCFADFEHDCIAHLGCVPAHDNSLQGGHGAGLKASDNRHASVCQEAHDLIDGRKGGWSQDEKRGAWERAYIATQYYYWTNGKVKVA
jgi:hypothetical protein